MELTKSFFLPEEYKEHFYVEDFLEIEDGYKLIIYEKSSNIPMELAGKKTVSNGFCNPVELIDHPLKSKLMYLEFYRRRWKEAGTDKSFSNSYELHPKGCKLTKGFGDFLKELTGQERSELFATVKGLESVWEENKLLV